MLEYLDSMKVTYIAELGNMYETNPEPRYLLPNNVKAVEDL